MECIFCGRTIGKHLKSAADHSCRTKKQNMVFGKFDNEIATLISGGESVLSVATQSIKLFGISIPYRYIQRMSKWTNIQLPNLSQAASSNKTRERYRNTVEQKYGTGITNVSQVVEVKQKKNNTNLYRYGVSNPFNREEIKEKTRQTLNEKYGVDHPIHIPSRGSPSGMYSKPHKKVSEYLTELGILHINDCRGKFKKFSDVFNRMYGPIPDIFIEEKNLVIEIYGDRWHMNPKLFNCTDSVQFFTGNRTAEQTWEHDRIRINHIESFGAKVIILWENDIKKDFCAVKDEILRSLNA